PPLATITKLCATALLAKAGSGDVPAINVLADRTDGKVVQALIGDREQDAVRVHHTIVRKIVEPDANQALAGAGGTPRIGTIPTPPCVGSAIAGGAASGISLAAKILEG